jgi:DNA-directed RNA polymerase
MHVIKVDATNKDTGEKVPCRRSFASGIAPNVVHSMDAAHMANTIVSFGGSFAAVHDSFSTHADDVDLLQDITKMTFTAQYDVENFFEKIEEMLITDRENFKIKQPEIGTLNVNGVADSEYFFC